ncbi:uncharacterized protein LOC135687493 [Rhopilema esculentum]|uniref:uncharacterized protein LOC135687493 n=1 Tax=Rhopilema esculentum TaxID=499914 RepID=UPI0031D8AFA6|eukprot:gene6139-11529_t
MAISPLKKVAITVNSVIFFVTMLMALVGYDTALYPTSVAKATQKYPTDLDAPDSAIWYTIYFFQCCWILYTLTLVFRQDAEDIIPLRCFVLYSFARVCSVVWRLIWSRDLSTVAPFVIILVTASTLNFCLLFVLKSANAECYNNSEGNYNKKDVWCTRVFVPNAIVFYSMWQDMSTCFSLNRMLIYDCGVSKSTAATVSLTVLLSLIVGWVVLENYFIEHFSRFLFLEYALMIVALGQVLYAQWKDGSGNQAYILAMLVLCCIFLLLRLAVIYVKEKNRLTTDSDASRSCLVFKRDH